MGQPVTVVHKLSSRPGVVRFEINRSITGMDHERFLADQEILGDRAVDQLARSLFEQGGVDALSINSNVITIDTAKGGLDIDATKALIADMFTYYRPGVEVLVFVADD
jgi:hypothetical protein